MQTVRTNLKINASTQYTNFNYTSMCRFNGIVLGAGTNGLFKACCGADDNGVDIDAYFVPALTDFGNPNKKLLNKLFTYGECTGSLTVTITGNENTVKGPYTIKFLDTEGQQRRRIPLGYKMKFTYGSFKFSNVDGCDFSVDMVIVKTVDLRHGVK